MIEFGKVLATRLGSRARTLLAQIRAAGDEGDDNDAVPADDVEVVQPLGLFARPVIRATLEAVLTRIGDQFVAVGLLDKGLATESSVQPGETRVFAAGWPSVHVKLFDGLVEVRVGCSGELRLAPDHAGYAGQAVARVGDATTAHTHTITGTAGPYPIVATVAPAAPTIAAGAPGVKA